MKMQILIVAALSTVLTAAGLIHSGAERIADAGGLVLDLAAVESVTDAQLVERDAYAIYYIVFKNGDRVPRYNYTMQDASIHRSMLLSKLDVYRKSPAQASEKKHRPMRALGADIDLPNIAYITDTEYVADTPNIVGYPESAHFAFHVGLQHNDQNHYAVVVTTKEVYTNRIRSQLIDQLQNFYR